MFTVTRRINNAIADDIKTAKAVTQAIGRFYSGDWGELSDDDKEANNADFRARDGHVLGRYKTPAGDIYINLEFGRTEKEDHVCAMFCDEW